MQSRPVSSLAPASPPPPVVLRMPRSHKSRGGAPVALPVSTPPPAQVELDQQHAIDMPAKRATNSKAKGKKQKQAHVSDDETDDDPYTSPPASASSHAHASTVGDQFYDSFAALEKNIAICSAGLSQVIKILKQIRLHPHLADHLGEELDDKLTETGALLDEITLIQKKFNSLSTQSNAAVGQFSEEEQSTRTNLKSRVSQDIHQMARSYKQIRQASLIYLPSSAANSTYDPDEDEDKSAHASLLNGRGADVGGVGYQQQSEWIGELDGHLAMLAEQAAERAAFMRTIESDVIQVRDLFEDVNQMVYAQQPMIDDIEGIITETQENARQGMDQLIEAQQYQAAKRKKMCFLVLMAVIAILLFFLFVWVAFSN